MSQPVESGRVPVAPPRAELSPLPTLYLSSRRVPAQESGGQGFNPWLIWVSICYWWKFALPAGILLAAAAVAGVWYTFEREYEGTAWLEIKDHAQFIAFENGDSSARFISNQIELIRSPLVLGRVLEDAKIARLPEVLSHKDPMSWLARSIQVRAVGNSEYFIISLAGPNAANAADIVNATVRAYDKLRNEKESEGVGRVIELLRQESVRQTQELERLREKVRTLHVAVTGEDASLPADRRRPSVPRSLLTEYQSQLAAAEMERRVLEARVAALDESRGQIKIEIPEVEIEKTLAQTSAFTELQTTIAAKDEARQDYESRLLAPQQNATYLRLVGELGSDRQRLKAMVDAMRTDMHRRAIAAATDHINQELTALRQQILTQKIQEEVLGQRCKQEIQEVTLDRGEGLQLEFARAELARAEEVYSRIANRILALQTEARAPERVTVLKEATPAEIAVESVPLKKMGLAGAVGFVIPFALAVAWEMVVRRVTSAEQIERESRLPVVGEIAQLPVRSRSMLGVNSRRLDRDVRLFEESVDSLRTCLLLSNSLRDAKVLTVTSSVKGEGKTSVSVQMAVSLARASGRRTLLVDGDIRDPDVHTVLGMKSTPGLAEVLSRRATLDEAIVTSWSELVHVLPAGRAVSSPHRLLGGGRFQTLIDELRARYDYIVVDTPPVLAAGEALVLAENADVTLLCAMKDSSRLDQIFMTHSRLVSVNARPAGVVLNGVPTRGYTARYGTYGQEKRSDGDGPSAAT